MSLYLRLTMKHQRMETQHDDLHHHRLRTTTLKHQKGYYTTDNEEIELSTSYDGKDSPLWKIAGLGKRISMTMLWLKIIDFPFILTQKIPAVLLEIDLESRPSKGGNVMILFTFHSSRYHDISYLFSSLYLGCVCHLSHIVLSLYLFTRHFI